eukprot:g10377.t1
MKPRNSLGLVFLIASAPWSDGGSRQVVSGFHEPAAFTNFRQKSQSSVLLLPTPVISSGSGSRRGGGFVGGLHAKAADPPSSSAAPGKEDEERKSSDNKKRRRPRRSGGGGGKKALVKQVVEAWAENSLDLRRFQGKRVHICKAETLPEVLSDFWSLASEMAQEKYSAMASDREYAGHALFVVTRCDLLKDYGMMRHLDKVLDFCSGGCSDFGRTVTLQHYHPDFVLPPSQTRSADDPNSKGLARFINFSRSPYPMFGLTASAGSPVRPSLLEVRSDKIARLRLDLELVYNSVAGRSTDDNVDSHGSPHGTIPSSPEEVQDKTLDWLYSLPSPSSSSSSSAAKGNTPNARNPWAGKDLDEGVRAGGDAAACKERKEGGESAYTNHGTSSLTSSYEGGLVTSGVNTPEKILSEVWSIVTQLQKEAAPLLVAAESKEAATVAPPAAASSATAAAATLSSTSSPDPTGTAATTPSPLAAMAAAVAAVEQWATGGVPWRPQQHQQQTEGGVEGAKEKRQAKVDLEGEAGPSRKDGAEESRRPPLVSTLLVAPRLHPFNAAKFDNFARNLAIALKQTPIMDRIEVEVYHPELVCDGGVVDLDRRSPYPTLLLKHCGLKEVLFEPSGKFRHALPPLKLPLEDAAHAQDEDQRNNNGNEKSDASSTALGPAGDLPADDAQL